MSRPTTALGKIIRRQRQLNRLTLRQFAAMSGISNPYLSQIERGLRDPSESVIDAIARSLKTSVDALYEQAGLGMDNGEAARKRIEDVLRADPALTARQRQVLMDVYDGLLAAGSKNRARRRPKPQNPPTS